MSADALAGETNVANRNQKSTTTLENKTMKSFGENNAY